MEAVADSSTIAIGDVLDGKYKITEVLGEGAMGVVYLALHTRLQRNVALKTLRAEFADDVELVERFDREARAASAIGHPNIVQVFDAGGETGGTPYLVMEHLKGESLGELLYETGALSIERSIDICCQVLAGLGAAHSAGILHRDLKPDNIFVTKDAEGAELVKILDFGISKALDIADPSIVGDGSKTRIGTILGTPLYMSPEQASGRADLDLRADLWAVVCVLYECVTGKTPFNGENYNQILAAVLQGVFVGLKEHRPEVPPELHALVQRGLKVSRGDRYPDATSLSVALTSISSAVGTPAAAKKEPVVAKKDPDKLKEDPAMLSAFDNLADKFLQQEREDSVDVEIPQQNFGPTDAASTPAPPAGAVATPAPKAAAPALDPFAPPDSQVALSLELETDPATPGPTVKAAERIEPAPRPKTRARSQLVTRDEPSRVGSFLLKSLLLIVLVGAAGAGYRYYTYGSVMPQPKAAAPQLTLELHPGDTQVFLNDVLVEEREINLTGGKVYKLRLSVEGRLEMQGQMEVQAGDRIRVSESMWHHMFRVDAAVVAAVKESELEPASAAQVAATRAKIEAFGDCGSKLAAALTEELAERGSKKLPKGLPRTLTDECGVAFDLAIAEEPETAALDKASQALRDNIANYGQAIVEQKKSKGAARGVMQAKAAATRKAANKANASAKVWGRTMSKVQVRVLAEEAVLVESSGGNPLHSDVRSLAVSSDAWMRTHLSGKNAKAQRALMTERFSGLARTEAQRGDELKRSGVTAYLNALKPLIDKEPGEDALFWHNSAVDVFNKIRLPLSIAVDSADP